MEQGQIDNTKETNNDESFDLETVIEEKVVAAIVHGTEATEMFDFFTAMSDVMRAQRTLYISEAEYVWMHITKAYELEILSVRQLIRYLPTIRTMFAQYNMKDINHHELQLLYGVSTM
jgi:hypothetical protein